MTANPKISQSGSEYSSVEFDNILKCVHCGLCLDSCPTYRESGLEQDSPRGRLYIMSGVWKGELGFNRNNVEFLDRCLDCRACETACPSKVPYGELIEKTRGVLRDRFRPKDSGFQLRNFFFRKVLVSDKMLVFFSKFLKYYGLSQLWRLVGNEKFKKILPAFVSKGQALLPKFSGESFKTKFAGVHRPTRIVEKPTRVSFFSGCVADVSDQDVHKATLRLLLRSGAQVNVPKNQSCCGALQVHDGDRETGRAMAEKNLEAFAPIDADYVITNAGGCSAQLKEYHLLFGAQDPQVEKLKAFESKIIDILEYLGLDDSWIAENNWESSPVTVFYDAPCHLMHAQKIDKNPRKLLASIPSVNLVTLDESEYCCGSAGIYNLLQPELSEQILDRKIESIKRAGRKHPEAHILLTGNPGCLFQIRHGLKKHGLPIQAVHPAVFLSDRLKS